MSHDRTRPDRRTSGEEEKNTDRGKHPSCGFPGKLTRARSTAPEEASDDEINAVALTAHTQGRDPADVWNEQGTEPNSEYVPDGGSKYTNPTGKGYLATYNVGNKQQTSLTDAAVKPTGWTELHNLVAVKDDCSLLILPENDISDSESIITTVTVGCQDNSIGLSRKCLKEIGVSDGRIRVYDRPENGLTVVPANRDPFIQEGDR